MTPPAPVLVTGGTGTLGRHLVPLLRTTGSPVRVLTRREEAPDGVAATEYRHGDLATGRGLAAAVDGAKVVVHCASAKKGDEAATRNLVRALTDAGAAPHLVYVSIVGVDRVPFGYFRAKLAAEEVVAKSGLPWTVLRATQFYDLVRDGARTAARLPLVPVPSGFRVQPVHPADVAEHLVRLAFAAPAGLVPDLAGPEVTDAAEMIRSYLRHRGRRPVVPLRLPRTRAVREGALLPGPGHTRGTTTWQDFLAADAKR